MLRISRYFVGNGPRAVPHPFAPMQRIVPLSPDEVSRIFDKHCLDKLYYGWNGKKRLT